MQPPTNLAAPLSRRDRPSVSQHQDVPSGNHSTRPMYSNAEFGRLEGHNNSGSFPGQIENNLDRSQGQRSRGSTSQRRRGRSPRRREAEKLQLAVSSGRLELTFVFCTDCV